jgi:hypothetical protein
MCPNSFAAGCNPPRGGWILAYPPGPGDEQEQRSERERQQKALDLVNDLWKEKILERNRGLEQLGRSNEYTTGEEYFPQNPHLRPLFSSCFPGSRFSSLPGHCPPQRVPLNECVLAIAWDFTHCSTFAFILCGKVSLEDLANLLPRAAAYQAEHQEVFTPN